MPDTDTNENTQDSQQQINRHFLRYLRENAKLTQEQLAQEVGVETELVRHWEIQADDNRAKDTNLI